VTDFKKAQGVSIWSDKTDIELFPHCLRQSVSKKIALLMGIDPGKTCTNKMQERIENIVNAQSQTKHTIALYLVKMKVGKKKNVLWALSTGAQDAPQVTSLEY